jgi:hypothetical protein
MAGQREDYLLREINKLRVLVAALLDRQPPAEIEHALELALALQVKLFPLPPQEFLALDAVGQFERLREGLTAEDAAEKVQTYAELLFHAATLYELKDRPDLATGARQLSLHLALLAALALDDRAGDGTIALLRQGLAGEHLHAPVQALLEEFDRTRG